MRSSSGIAAAAALGLAVLTLIMLRSHDAAQAQDDPETGPHAPSEQVAHIAPTPAGPPTRWEFGHSSADTPARREPRSASLRFLT